MTAASFLQSETPVRWLFYGDSITHGARHTYGGRDFSEHFRERVGWELQRGGDAVINTAHSGFGVEHLLRDFDFRVSRYAPHVTFVMIGTNDAALYGVERYVAGLTTLLAKLRELDTVVVLQTPVPVYAEFSPNRATLPEYVAAMRELARRENVELIDHYAIWSNFPSRIYCMSDSMHPNAFGHLKIAHDIFRHLGCFDPASDVCTMKVPQ